MKSFFAMLVFFVVGGLLIRHGSSYGLALGIPLILAGLFMTSLLRKACREVWQEWRAKK